MIAAMLASLGLNSAAAAGIGQIAPEFELPGQSGQALRLSGYRDKFVFLYFWTSWCGTCIQGFPWLAAMQSRYGEKGLQIIAVNVDVKAEDAKNFLVENPVNFLVAMDNKAKTAQTYQIKALHTSLLVAPGGEVMARKVVVNSADKEMVESGIRQALSTR